MCAACGHQASVIAGTIFQGTRTPLSVWFRAIWWVVSQKNGASALGLQRVLGLGSYRTAWTWLHKLRRAMVRPGRDRVSEEVEVDETLVGGLEAGGGRRHLGKKALVVIAAEVRGRAIGRIRMQRVADASADSLLTFVQHAVQPGSVVITDGLQSYRRLPKRGYRHDRRVLLGRGESAEAVLPRVHQIGFFAVLHTWGQTLVHHPHLHCVVPGGGLSPDGTQWVSCRPGFFLPVRVLSRLVRRLLLDAVCEAVETGQVHFAGTLDALNDRQHVAAHLQPARQTDWVVYAKPPFAGPDQVLDYVGRYTHRIAISNQRLLALDAGQVRFRYTDYRRPHAPGQKTMTLAATEFIRRVLLHVLPRGFHRMRYYGLLANRTRHQHVAQCRQLLGTRPPTRPDATPGALDYRDRYHALTGRSLRVCPRCHDGQMQLVDGLDSS